MKVALRIDGPVRRWHDRLRDALAAMGHELVVRRAPGRALPIGLAVLMAIERRLYGARPDLFVPATSHVNLGDGALELEPRFNGIAGERALVEALLARRAPRIDIVDSSGRLLAAGLPAIEAPSVLAMSLDQVLARTLQLVVEAVRLGARQDAPQDVSAPLQGGPAPPLALFFAKTLAAKLAARLEPPDARLPVWRIAARAVETPNAALARDLETAPFVPLAHDGRRFQADPFLLSHGGRTCLFFEDFPFATRKGVIAMRERDGDGRWSASRVVLEQPFHLSYPHLLVVDGDVYMLPEMSAAGCLRLYRADPFPDRFVPDRVLVDGVEAHDATLIQHDGVWWMFATLSGDGGSKWDALGLYSAPHPFGPWTPHSGNPVLIDAGVARPAGEMWHEGGTLMRVAQDCRAGYGSGLAICRVDRLDSDGYAQTVIARLGAPAGHGAQCVHTLNRAAGVEVIDLA